MFNPYVTLSSQRPAGGGGRVSAKGKEIKLIINLARFNLMSMSKALKLLITAVVFPD